MTKFQLQIREHEEFGCPGIYFYTGRDYFQPAITGLQVAHDILEHTVQPHSNGFIDELIALGSVVAGRIASGRHAPRGYRRIDLDDLSSDISSLTNSSLMESEELCAESCTSYLQDSELMAAIRHHVVKGLIEGINEYEDASYTVIPDHYDYDVDSIVGWICKGYQQFRKRFSPNIYDVSTYFFNRIAEVCDDWMKTAVEGETAELILNFSSLRVTLVPDY